MKTLTWQRYFDEQRRVHGKTLFTATELANVAGASLHALNVVAARLRKQGVLVRYARGLYGPPESVTPEQLARSVDSHAYLTSSWALFSYGLITQAPVLFTCFTDRRHNRARERDTPLGKLLFVCVRKPVYHPPERGVVAGPEQALFDYVYLMRRHGADPLSTATFRRVGTLRRSVMARIGRRYPDRVRRNVSQILHSIG